MLLPDKTGDASDIMIIHVEEYQHEVVYRVV